MFCAYTRPRYQVSVYRTIGPLFLLWYSLGLPYNYFVFKGTLDGRESNFIASIAASCCVMLFFHLDIHRFIFLNVCSKRMVF